MRVVSLPFFPPQGEWRIANATRVDGMAVCRGVIRQDLLRNTTLFERNKRPLRLTITRENPYNPYMKMA